MRQKVYKNDIEFVLCLSNTTKHLVCGLLWSMVNKHSEASVFASRFQFAISFLIGVEPVPTPPLSLLGSYQP